MVVLPNLFAIMFIVVTALPLSLSVSVPVLLFVLVVCVDTTSLLLTFCARVDHAV